LSAHGGLLATSRPSGGELEKDDDSGAAFCCAKNVRKRDGRLERAKLAVAVAAAREHAAATARAKKYEVLMRPTVLQGHRLAKRLSSVAMA
jgi:hypothetical protein